MLLPMTYYLKTYTPGLQSPWQQAKLKISCLNKQQGNCICYLEVLIFHSVHPFRCFLIIRSAFT